LEVLLDVKKTVERPLIVAATINKAVVVVTVGWLAFAALKIERIEEFNGHMIPSTLPPFHLFLLP